MRGGLVAAALLLMMGSADAAAEPAAAASSPLTLEAKIPLGTVSGRIDHLAIDVRRRRLLVAELGNNSLGVVDLAAAAVLRTIAGFREPQGIGYEPATDTVYVANAGDGSVVILRGEDFAALGRMDLGSDADNVRIDTAHGRVLVGHSAGGLASIDPARRAKVGDIRLPAHPESFQLAENGRLAFINVPDARQIVIADLAGGTLRGVATGNLRANFPMAIDAAAQRVLVAFRSPPVLAAYTIPDGQMTARLSICGDSDDVFVDAKRHRIYVSCGAGAVDVIEPTPSGYARVAQVPTAPGARTSLFVPELDRLYVAARASWVEPAAIWVFRPPP